MKYSVATKFIAVILCAVSLVACVGSALGIVVNESNGLYTDDINTWLEDELYHLSLNIAHQYAELYNAEHLGGCSESIMDALRDNYPYGDPAAANGWSVTLMLDGNILVEGDSTLPDAVTLTYHLSTVCPVPADSEIADSFEAEPLYIDFLYLEAQGQLYMNEVEMEFYEGPEYEVLVYLQPHVVEPFRASFMEIMFNLRYYFIGLLVIGLLAFSASLVYLCCAAGRRPGSDQVYPVALNRLPLDLYAILGGMIQVGLSWLLFEMVDACVSYGGNWGVASLIGLTAFAMALTTVAFLFACAAQLKTKGGFWWRRTLLGWCVVRLLRGLRWMGRACAAVFRMLPLIWQWLLAAAMMAACPILFIIFAAIAWDGFWQLFWGLLAILAVLGAIALIIYWAYSLGQLMKGATIMSQGGLHYQIPTRHMTGKFRDFAGAINAMAGAARIAAERQLKSERMKTELITNVSHDIKTPLTSIINYVDLLKKPHDDAQARQYLEVLDRQSLRLKKLIDDLMEMSKASTGNIAVELGHVDAVEAINQALGEFSDKLAASDLDPVFRCPQGPVMIRADGKLLWRVMSNLLSNAVKYAMPGTRLYLDLLVIQGNAVLNMKNISRDQLNVGADELMERFVRGDVSRNTEGSGLGLNIARSLVELQKGQMHLMVDGDLFKVTLVFPLA